MKHLRTSLAVALAAGALLAAPAAAQQADEAAELRQQLEQLRKEHEATQQELSELKEILAPILDRLPKPFREQDASIANAAVLGDPNAPLTMIEFSDLQCPFCQGYYENTFPDIRKQYVDTGKLRYVVEEFPLSQIHPQAKAASRAALCAGDQDKGQYWKMRDQVFANRDNLSEENLVVWAQGLGLDMDAWNTCMQSDIYEEKVATDLAAGAKLGVSGTPGFVLGYSKSDDTSSIRAMKMIEGAYPFEAFQEAFDQLLADSGASDTNVQ